MKSKLFTLGCVLILSTLLVSGCGTTTAEPTSGLANPAAVYCDEQGYTLEMRTDEDGGQYGVCIFPDGSECEEWAYYRGECSPASASGAATETPTAVPTTTPTEAATAQPTEAPTPVELAETWVYVDLAEDQSGTTVTWVDMGSGTANSVPAPGIGHQVVGEWVYYQENVHGTVHRVNAARQDERFDFMGIPEDYLDVVEWAISPDGTQIVWKLSVFEPGEGYSFTLTSELYVATIATGETRLLTTQAVHEHRTLTPWGFSPDGSRVFVYQQPYGVGGLFLRCGEFSVLDVATAQLTPLPDPVPVDHFGAAALSDEGARLARFGYTEGEGFKVSLTELASGQTTEIVTPSTDLGLVQVGDGVFSPDGSTLVYTVAYGDWGGEGFALFQVDSTTGTQREILAPQPTHYKVARFEDDGSLLLTIAWPGEGTGTFRLHPDGTLEHLSESTFLGVVPPTPTPEPPSAFRSIENSLVVFEREGKIFLLDGLNSQPIEVAEGNKPNWSPERSKIAYVKMDEDNNIHIYEVETGKTETLTTEEGRLRGVSWSPNGKYLITDSGTGPMGTGGVYEYPTGRKVASFTTYVARIGWVSDEEFVFVEPQEVVPPRPWGGGEGSGLSKITLAGGEKQLLAQATASENFSLLLVEDGMIYFSKTTVESSDDWASPDKGDVSHWQMNSDGEGKREMPKPEDLSEEVTSHLPTKFSGYRVFSGPIPHPDENNWVIFDINKEGSVYNDPICIMNLNNPRDSFMQVATGSYPSW